MDKTADKVTVAAIADIHFGINSGGTFRDVFQEISEKAEMLLLAGDLTQHGDVTEASALAEELRFLKIPTVMVLGNHDYDHGYQDQIKEILTGEYSHVLDGEFFVHNSVGVAGVKGFVGGFNSHMLASFGEPELKEFVGQGVNEALKLESSLNLLETPKKIVLLHYSPIRETVIGEPEEIFPFLGSTRLEEPIDHIDVDVVFHGHAHHGSHKGKTQKGIPVFNVAQPLLESELKKPYLLYTL